VSVDQRMSDDSKRFKVNDRRLFTREGEKREAEEAAEVQPPSPPPAEARPSPPRPERPAPPPPLPDAEEGPRGLDFVGLLMSLGAQASALLVGDPGTGGGGHPPDLAGARAFISLLEVLKEKTEGRRTGEEDEVLESLLYELRMGYVAVSRAGGA
jgi:uncharacterized protein DUF1844